MLYTNGFIPILNTPDKIDAYYGIVGTIIPFIYLFFFQKVWNQKKYNIIRRVNLQCRFYPNDQPLFTKNYLLITNS